MKKKRVIGYVRVSTDGQGAEDKFGIASQKASIQEYCDRHGYVIDSWKEDIGISGSAEAEDDREAMNEIIYGEVKNPPIEAVVVAKSDRIARDMNLYFYYKMQLKRKGMEVVSVIDDTDRFGEFAGIMEAFLMFAAEQERKNITRRTSLGRNQKAKLGKHAGGGVPYGYQLKEGKMVPEPEEAEIVKDIFWMRAQGYSLTKICDKLRMNGDLPRTGKAFYPTTIKKILENKPFYWGKYKYGDVDWVDGEHEPLFVARRGKPAE
jgi:DNA invertase Pin-like site-specific DNA recombinase